MPAQWQCYQGTVGRFTTKKSSQNLDFEIENSLRVGRQGAKVWAKTTAPVFLSLGAHDAGLCCAGADRPFGLTQVRCSLKKT